MPATTPQDESISGVCSSCAHRAHQLWPGCFERHENWPHNCELHWTSRLQGQGTALECFIYLQRCNHPLFPCCSVHSVPGVIPQHAGSTETSGQLFHGSTPFGFTLCCVLPLCCTIIISERSFSLHAARCDASVLPTSQELVFKPACACTPLSLIPTLHPSPDQLSTPTLVSPLYENTSPALLFCSREPHTESRRCARRLARPH